jgi:nitrogen fixation/metabolism regulation signal transduction histidine kinase
LQRRLFILFLLLSFLPAAVILLVNWHMSQRHLGLLDSPGLLSSLENSLALARETLDRELAATRSAAEKLAAVITTGTRILPPAPPGATYRFTTETGGSRIVGVGDEAFFNEVDELYTGTGGAPFRVKVGETNWLASVVSLPDGQLLFLRPLRADLASQLDAVAQGSNRFRQLRLFYKDLLRGNTMLTLLVLGLALLALSLYLSRRLARQIAGPVVALARGTERVAEGDLDSRVEVRAPDELGELVEAFNRMTGDLKTSKMELVRAERVAAWQGIARRLAHEIKNPLTPITLAMHRIRKQTGDPVVVEAVDTVLEEAENLTRLADEFSLYARLPEPNRKELDLTSLVRGVVELYVDPGRVEVRWDDWEDAGPVWADPGQLRRVFANIIKNAVDAMGEGGVLSLSQSKKGGYIKIRVADSGPGLPEPPERVFEPYFTTRDTGTGLGLAIARKIVEDHGGTLTAEMGEEGGAVFSLVLPSPQEKKT